MQRVPSSSCPCTRPPHPPPMGSARSAAGPSASRAPAGRRRWQLRVNSEGLDESVRAMLRQVCALGSVRTSCSLAAPALTAEGGERRERHSPRPDDDRPGATSAGQVAVRVLPRADRSRCVLLLVDSETAALGVLPGLSTAGDARRPHLASLAGRGQRGHQVGALSGPLHRSSITAVSLATVTKEPIDDDA
jgi:hypothetical protein